MIPRMLVPYAMLAASVALIVVCLLLRWQA
jgi:hypothetical protein